MAIDIGRRQFISALGGAARTSASKESTGEALDHVKCRASETNISVILVTLLIAAIRASLDCQRGDTTMKEALVVIALTLALVAGTAAEMVQTHQAVVYATTD